MRTFAVTTLFLAGCGAIVPSTVARLASVSPLEADPAGFAVLMDLPEGLSMAPAGQALTFTATDARGERRDGRFAIIPTETSRGTLWRIDPGRLDALRDMQAKVREWEDRDPDGTTGSLGIEVTGCRVGDGPDPGDRLTIYLRTAPDAPLRPLLRRARVSDVLGEDEVAALAPCP